VLKEKRKKLKETFDRVMRLIHEDEPEMWSDMKRKEVEYEKRKYKRVQYFESVRHAEQVSIEDIPLPSSTNEKPIPATIPKINLPPPILLLNVPPPATLMKKSEEASNEQSQESKEKEPPGVPPHLPPNIFEMRELDSDYESDHIESEDEEQEASNDDLKKDKHDKKIEEFIKEVESAQKKKEEEKALEIRVDPTPEVEMEEKNNAVNEIQPVQQESIPIPQTMPPALSLPRLPYPMFRPPPMRGGFMRLPGPPRPNMGMPRMGAGIRIPGKII
jgi:WW domain-binding protein 11